MSGVLRRLGIRQSRDPGTLLVFTVGTGRSGTHFVGDILAGHPEIEMNVERPPIWPLVRRLAVDPRQRPELLPELVELYRRKRLDVAPKHLADKSHPVLWLAEELAAAFPQAKFVGTQRDPYGTIASMLRHPDVLAWHARWRELPIPNAFLGIDRADAAGYEALPIEVKCAMRWRSHGRETERLAGILGDRMLVLRYEDLIRETAAQVARLSAFLGLATPIPLPEVRAESLDRWRSELSAAQVEQIASVVGRVPV